MAGVGTKTKKKPPAKPAKKASTIPGKTKAAPARAKPKAPAARGKPKTTTARSAPKPAAPARPAPSKRAAPVETPAAPPPPGTPLSAPRTAPVVPSRGQVAPTARPLGKGDFALEKLHQIALTATNLDVSVAFYRDVLGLKFVARFDPPGIAYFNLGNGARLQLSVAASQASLSFAVDSVDKAVAELKKRGVNFLHPPMMVHRDVNGELGKKGGEEWAAFFRDPSGNTLALVERR